MIPPPQKPKVVIEESVGVEESPSKEEKIEEIVTQEPETKTGSKYSWIWGVVAAIISSGIIFLLLKREWKIIMKK